MSDQLKVQVRFKKVLWTCPKCSQEDIEDWNVGGGNDYEHDCSKCSFHFNQSGSNLWEYNGCLSYLKDDYESKKQEDIDTDKTKAFDDALYAKNNPPTYQEPSKEDLQNLYNEKMEEAKTYLQQYSSKATNTEFEAVKSEGIAKIEDTSKDG